MLTYLCWSGWCGGLVRCSLNTFSLLALLHINVCLPFSLHFCFFCVFFHGKDIFSSSKLASNIYIMYSFVFSEQVDILFQFLHQIVGRLLLFFSQFPSLSMNNPSYITSHEGGGWCWFWKTRWKCIFCQSTASPLKLMLKEFRPQPLHLNQI